MSIYVHEFQMAQAKANDVLESSMEEARKKLNIEQTNTAKAPVKAEPKKHPVKATVRKLKVSERKLKRA